MSEMDFNWHKSNSTYYSDLDIARTHLLCTLFSVGIDQARYQHGSGVLHPNDSFTIKLGAVSCAFKREIRPYQRYEMWTRVLSWDTKWLYTITHFARKDAKSGDWIVCASAVSKCVFKSRRRTVAPEVLLRASGLWPCEMLSQQPPPTVPYPVDPIQAPEKEDISMEREEWTGEDPLPQAAPQSGFLIGNKSEQSKAAWTTEMIENERRRGMETVCGGDLDLLEGDFRPETLLLGRHFDL